MRQEESHLPGTGTSQTDAGSGPRRRSGVTGSRLYTISDGVEAAETCRERRHGVPKEVST